MTMLQSTAGSGASAPAARPKAFPSFSLLIREPSASRPLAELRSRPFFACPLSRPPSIPIHYQLGLAAPSVARHRSFSRRPSLHPPSGYSARGPAPAGLAYVPGASCQRGWRLLPGILAQIPPMRSADVMWESSISSFLAQIPPMRSADVMRESSISSLFAQMPPRSGGSRQKASRRNGSVEQMPPISFPLKNFLRSTPPIIISRREASKPINAIF